MNREEAIALMIRVEGGFVDNPRDPGGATKYGITQRTLDAYAYLPTFATQPRPANVADLTEQQAAWLYRKIDWDVMRCDEMPPALACLLLNSAINQGEPTSVRLLQASLSVEQDGIVGPDTLAAIRSWKSPYMPEQTLAEEFAARAAVRYASLYGHEDWAELGWFRRLFRVYSAATTTQL